MTKRRSSICVYIWLIDWFTDWQLCASPLWWRKNKRRWSVFDSKHIYNLLSFDICDENRFLVVDHNITILYVFEYVGLNGSTLNTCFLPLFWGYAVLCFFCSVCCVGVNIGWTAACFWNKMMIVWITFDHSAGFYFCIIKQQHQVWLFASECLCWVCVTEMKARSVHIASIDWLLKYMCIADTHSTRALHYNMYAHETTLKNQTY